MVGPSCSGAAFFRTEYEGKTFAELGVPSANSTPRTHQLQVSAAAASND